MLIRELRLRVGQLLHTHRQFTELVREQKRWLQLAMVAAVGEVLFQALAPWPIKFVFDALLGDPTKETKSRLSVPEFLQGPENRELFLVVICGAILLIAVLLGTCQYYRAVWAATGGQRMIFKLRKRLYAHLQGLSLRFHKESRHGDVLLRITGDITMLRDVLSTTPVDLVARIGMIIVFMSMLLWLDPLTGGVAVAVVTIVTFLSGSSGKKIARHTKKQREKEGVLAHTAGETLSAMPLVKAHGVEEKVVRDFARKNRASMRSSLKGTRMQAVLSRRVEVVFAIGVTAVFALGVRRVWTGELSAGDLYLFVSYLRHLNKPLRKLSTMATRIGKASACGDRVLELMNVELEEAEDTDARPAPTFRGEIELQGLHFGYQEGHSVLRDLNLHIERGETIGLVGRNGAGKSTLLHLLLRLYEPTGGQILFDGHDTRDFQLKSLRGQIATALQSTLLFGTTIRENLLIAAPDATEDEIDEVLALVGAEFALELPDGIDTELAEKGQNLSGGEARKVSLAAALLRPAAILILDEPTAGIDHATQEDIIRRLPAICRGRTALIISHDPEMLEHLDRVVFLESGRIDGVGSHFELFEKNESYRELFAEGPSRSEATTP